METNRRHAMDNDADFTCTIEEFEAGMDAINAEIEAAEAKAKKERESE
jgi:hypothetical protein